MVRINLISPKYLTDQHLIAEYNEILMLESYLKKYPLSNKDLKRIPEDYCLGKGHMIFFKDKIDYLKQRHKEIKNEMLNRGFKTNKSFKLKYSCKNQKKNYTPQKKDIEKIKKRLIEKIKLKPDFYRYKKQYKNQEYYYKLIKKA